LKKLLPVSLFLMIAGFSFGQKILVFKRDSSVSKGIITERYDAKKARINYKKRTGTGSFILSAPGKESLTLPLEIVVGYEELNQQRAFLIYQGEKYQVEFGELDCGTICFIDRSMPNGTVAGSNYREYFFTLNALMAPVLVDQKNVVLHIFDGDAERLKDYQEGNEVDLLNAIKDRVKRNCNSYK